MSNLRAGRIALSQIVEGIQPRHSLKPEAIARMAGSLANIGQLSPVGLEQLGENSFRILYGHTRFHAAKSLGWASLTAVVMPKQDKPGLALRMAVSENTVREQMTFVELADAIIEYAKQTGLPLHQAGKELGFTQSQTSKFLRIDQHVTPENKKRLLDAGFGGSHAYLVSQERDKAAQDALVDTALSEHWKRKDFERHFRKKCAPTTRIEYRTGRSKIALEIPKGATGEAILELLKAFALDVRKSVQQAHTPETIAQIFKDRCHVV